jgi:tripartite-type tricarboxylate transporter receptor subunit TctC
MTMKQPLLAALAALAFSASAQNFPTRPVTLAPTPARASLRAS